MKLTLVRHGEIDTRYLGCYNGHNDIGLCEQGVEQAQTLARHFRETDFDAIYCSDLRRARETLAPFALQTQPYYTEKLREKSWGRHEGMSFEEISEKEGLTYENFSQWINALDGEPYSEYAKRIHRFFLEELPQKNHRNVLVMTHAGVIRVLYAITQKCTLKTAFSLPLPYGSYVTYKVETNTFGVYQCVT